MAEMVALQTIHAAPPVDTEYIGKPDLAANVMVCSLTVGQKQMCRLVAIIA